MKITENTVVSLTYTLNLDNAEGELIEKVETDQPFVFIFGSGQLLQDFESEINGLEPGSSFEFTLTSEQAYGPVQDEAVVTLPINIFELDGKVQHDLLTIGNYLTMRDHNGQPLRGKVMKVTDADVTMDFNHPLAGQTLHFRGDIVDTREATAEELDHGHVHGPGGHHQ